MEKTVTIKIPDAISKKKSWRKTIDSINMEQKGGYAFIGEWLNKGKKATLPVGTFFMAYDLLGGWDGARPFVELYVVTSEVNEETKDHYKILATIYNEPREYEWATDAKNIFSDHINHYNNRKKTGKPPVNRKVRSVRKAIRKRKYKPQDEKVKIAEAEAQALLLMMELEEEELNY